MWDKYPHKFLYIVLRISWCDVLKRNVCINKVESIISEQLEVISLIQIVSTSIAVAIEFVSSLDHRWGNINAFNFVEIIGKRLS